GPAIAFGDVQADGIGLATGFPQGRILNNFQYQDTLSYTIGAHTIRGGVDLTQQRTKDLVPFNDRGTLTFSGSDGFNSFANFIDGFSGVEGTFASKVFGSQVVYPNRFQ